MNHSFSYYQQFGVRWTLKAAGPNSFAGASRVPSTLRGSTLELARSLPFLSSSLPFAMETCALDHQIPNQNSLMEHTLPCCLPQEVRNLTVAPIDIFYLHRILCCLILWLNHRLTLSNHTAVAVGLFFVSCRVSLALLHTNLWLIFMLDEIYRWHLGAFVAPVLSLVCQRRISHTRRD